MADCATQSHRPTPLVRASPHVRDQGKAPLIMTARKRGLGDVPARPDGPGLVALLGTTPSCLGDASALYTAAPSGLRGAV
jgi:hypothetical protein